MGSLLDRIGGVGGRARVGPLFGLLLGALLIVAQPAQWALAGNVDVDEASKTLRYDTDPGDAASLTVTRTGGSPELIIFVDNSAAGMTTSDDTNGICTVVTSQRVECDDVVTGPPDSRFTLLVLNGDDEDDFIKNSTNLRSTINGGDGDDELEGGDNRDEINGDDNDDIIKGNGGNDVINGGAGDDDIEGGAGNDTINGDTPGEPDDTGEDEIWGNDGDDTIDTGEPTNPDDEFVDGGDGDDVVIFRYIADPGDVEIKKGAGQAISVITDGGILTLLTAEELHIFNHDDDDSTDDYTVRDLTGRLLKVLVLQSESVDDLDSLEDGASVTVDGTTGNDSLALNNEDIIDSGDDVTTVHAGWGKITFKGPAAQVAGVSFIALNGFGGNDTFDVDLSTVIGNEVDLIIDGGTGNNVLSVANPDAGEYEIDLTGRNAGALNAGAAFGEIIFSNISRIDIDGNGDADDLHLETPEGADDIVYTPGVLLGQGSIQVLDIISINFIGLIGGELEFDSAGGVEDNLEYNGTSRNETFDIDGAGLITLDSTIDGIDVATPGIADLTLNAGNGNDTVNVNGQVPYSTLTLNGEDGNDTFVIVGGQTADIEVDGGAPTASDTLQLEDPDNNNAIDVDLEVSEVAGYSANPIVFSAIEHLVLQGRGNNDLTVFGTAGDDEIDYTPANATDGKVAPRGLDLKDIVFTGIGSGEFRIDGAGGDNVVRTIGSSLAEDIEIRAGDPETETQVESKKTLITPNDNTSRLAVDSAAGKDVIDVDLDDCVTELHLLLDGNTPAGTPLQGDSLRLFNGDSAQIFPGHDPASGNVIDCSNDVDIEYERIERVDLSGAGGDNGANASQPDGVFTNIVKKGIRDRKEILKLGGDNFYGAKNSGVGGANAGKRKGPKVGSNSGTTTVPFQIQNDGQNGTDSFLVKFTNPTGITIKVGGKSSGGTIGPIDAGNFEPANITIVGSSAVRGYKDVVINIFSVNGGGDVGGNLVDSVTLRFNVR